MSIISLLPIMKVSVAQKETSSVLCMRIFFFIANTGGGVLYSTYSRDERIGTIGVVGSQYLSTCPCEWWYQGPYIGGVRQGAMNSKGKYEIISRNDVVQQPTEVVIVDGLFIAIKKQLFDNNLIWWDEHTFNAFHMYDLDICMQTIAVGKKVLTAPIDIEHKSPGKVDDEYRKNLNLFYNKWERTLPIVRGVEISEIDNNWHYGYGEFAYRRLKYEFDAMKKSKAYRLGKFLLKPLNLIKRFV